MQKAIPCTLMRGGTSRGAYFWASDLPEDEVARDRILLSAMGSPDIRQIDGIGGATSLTSKVAILSSSDHPEVDVDYLFAQVSIEEAVVDTDPSCGNILSGVGPFVIQNGLVEANNGETLVRIRCVNTDSLVDAIVQTPGGEVEYEGSTAIDGVPGMAAPVLLNFKKIIGSKTGALLPTGNLKDIVDGVELSCVDVAIPMVLIAASSLGKNGHESKAELDGDVAFLERLERIRRAAAHLMGMGDVSVKVIPKVGLLSFPREGGNITSRYFVPDNCHPSHAVTGAICVSVATALKGSVAGDLVIHEEDLPTQCVIEHPSGRIVIFINLEPEGDLVNVISAGILRTARRLLSGQVYINL